MNDWATAINSHTHVIEQLKEETDTINSIIQCLVDCLQNGFHVYTIGNGGSAADAQHISAEMLGRYKLNRQPYPVIALTTDTSTLTAVSNDMSFHDIFSRQLEAVLKPLDVVWALSTSGNSPNILAALEVAKNHRAEIIGFTGESGGKMAPYCNHILRVKHQSSDRIQEAHLLAYHYICERVEALLS